MQKSTYTRLFDMILKELEMDYVEVKRLSGNTILFERDDEEYTVVITAVNDGGEETQVSFYIRDGYLVEVPIDSNYGEYLGGLKIKSNTQDRQMKTCVTRVLNKIDAYTEGWK